MLRGCGSDLLRALIESRNRQERVSIQFDEPGAGVGLCALALDANSPVLQVNCTEAKLLDLSTTHTCASCQHFCAIRDLVESREAAAASRRATSSTVPDRFLHPIP